MKEKVAKALVKLSDAGFDVAIKGDKLMMSNFDGILGGFGVRGWQWEKFRAILVANGLDYYIDSLDCGNFVIILIPIGVSMDY